MSVLMVLYIRVPGSGVVTLRRVRGARGPALVVGLCSIRISGGAEVNVEYDA
jgi:hypothetical protein